MEPSFDDLKDHPLSLELSSLQESVAQHQHAAHAISGQLQKVILERIHAQDEAQILRKTNVFLEREVKLLRSKIQHPAQEVLQIDSDLSLSLQRTQEKVKFLETALSEHLKHHVALNSTRDNLSLKIAFLEKRLLDTNTRRDHAVQRFTTLESEIRQLFAEKEMSHLALAEYADLVRNLENRSSPSNETIPLGVESDSAFRFLGHARAGLQKLLAESSQEVDRLHSEISSLHSSMEQLQGDLQTAQQKESSYQSQIVALTSKLQLYEIEDKSASKMVEKYMSFSQASTRALQTSLELGRSRYSAQQDTLHHKIDSLELALRKERALHDRFRQRFDVIGEELSRANFGRRREASLRLKLILREERLTQGLNRIIFKLEEARSSGPVSQLGTDYHDAILANVLCMALALRDSLDGSNHHTSKDGSLGRLILAHDTVNQVLSELGAETERRLALEIRAAPSAHQDSSFSGTAGGHESVSSYAATLHQTPQMGTVSSLSADGETKECRDLCQLTKDVGNPAHLPSRIYDPNFSLMKNDQRMPPLPSWPQEAMECVLGHHERVQRQFRDCHTSVVALVKQFESAQAVAGNQENFGRRALRLLSSVGTRLQDIIEDILVEVEIKISDDVRTIQGFQTLLALAITPDFPSPHGHSHADIENDFRSFINESSSRLGTIVPEQKLDDVQHDLAKLKLAFHTLSFPQSAETIQSHGASPSHWDSFVSSLDFRLTMLPLVHQGDNSLDCNRTWSPIPYTHRTVLDRSRVSNILGLRSFTSLADGVSYLDISPIDNNGDVE